MQVGGYTHLKPWRMGVAPGERLPAWDKATMARVSERRFSNSLGAILRQALALEVNLLPI
jgi:hypothetical protein